MNKAFEKIKVASAEIVVHGTSEKPYYEIKDYDISDGKYHIGYSSYDLSIVFGWLKGCFEIVQEVAEEYNSGWIPCSVDLPKEKDGIVLICCEDGNVMTGKRSEFDDTWFKGDMYAVGGSDVIAWQPLPEPFKESD